MEMLKVSSKSNPGMVAGAIAGVIRTNGSAELQAIGGGAVNVTVKAIAIASSFLAEEGITISFLPSFTDIKASEELELTAISFKIDSKKE